jgi:hypothetical protein
MVGNWKDFSKKKKEIKQAIYEYREKNAINKVQMQDEKKRNKLTEDLNKWKEFKVKR